MHLCSDKGICPIHEYWSLEFFIWNIFEKAPLGPFPYRAHMSHKNDSPNLTKNSSGLLKDWWSNCLSNFFSFFNSWKVTSVYRGYFWAICRLCSLNSCLRIASRFWFRKISRLVETLIRNLQNYSSCVGYL